MPDYYVYRPRSNWAYLAIIIVMGSFAIGGFYYSGRTDDAIKSLVNTLGACIVFWVFVVHPKVVYTATGIEIHNPFRTIKIGWLKTEDFFTKYAFTVTTATGNFSAWAAPAPSRFNARKIHLTDWRGTGLENRKVISPNDSPRAESGVAMILALRHRDDAVAKGKAGEHEIRQFNWLTLVLFVSGALALLTNLFQ